MTWRMGNKVIRQSTVAMCIAVGCASGAAAAASPPPCSDAWYRSIDAKVRSADGQGHGPDVGSDEWKSTIEFRLGVRGKPGVPKRDTGAWCSFIEQRVDARAVTASSGQAPAAPAKGPSFDCRKVAPSSIEATICADGDLSALDRKLASVYAAATRKAANERPPRLRAEQSGWIKGRNDCWKSDDKRACVRLEYVRRIAELQARYRLVPSTGPVAFGCEGSPANEIVVTFFETEPPTLIAERGDSVSLMYLQSSGSDARYQGRNETFREQQGEAMVTWGYGAPEMRCRKKS